METRSVVFRGWILGKESDNTVPQGNVQSDGIPYLAALVICLYSSKLIQVHSRKVNFIIFILYFIFLTEKKESQEKVVVPFILNLHMSSGQM